MSMTDTPVARYSDVAAALDAIPPDQPGRTLDLIARMLDLTDLEVCERTGRRISRATVNAKRKRRSPMRVEDLWPLADALELSIDVLLMPPAAAARWLADHHAGLLDAVGLPPNGGEPSTGVDRSRCTATNLTYLLYRDILAGHRRTVAQAA